MYRNLILAFVIVIFSCNQEKNSDSDSVVSGKILEEITDANLSKERKYDRLKRLKTKLLNSENTLDNRTHLLDGANMFYEYDSINDFLETTNAAARFSIQANDSLNLAKAFRFKAEYYRRVGFTDSSLYFYLKAEKLFQKTQNSEGLGKILLGKGILQFYESDYLGSELSLTRALSNFSEENNEQSVYEALTMIGIISNDLKEYDKAIIYHGKAYKLAVNKNLRGNGQAETSLNNIGNVYQNLNNYETAIKYYNDALNANSKLRVQFPDIYAMIIDNLAYSKLQQRSLSDVKVMLEESFLIRDSLNFLSGKVYNKIHLSQYYDAIGDEISAINEAHAALTIATLSKSPHDLLSSLKQVTKVDVSRAGYYTDIYIRINDSLQQSERLSKDKFARIQFETDEISQENDKLNTQNRNLAFFFVGTVMIGLLLFVIRTQRAKNRELLLKQAQQKANEDIYNLMLAQQNNIEEGRIKEKKRIAQELHDGILSRLFGARLNLDSLNRVSAEEAREKSVNYLNELKNIEQDIREISHDLNREKIVLINNFLAILTNLFEEQSANFAPEVEMEFDDSIKWDEVSNNLKINIYRIFQEALQNINKYAQANHIKVALTREDSNIVLDVVDDGIGFDVDKKSKGIGVQNMVSRVNECNGSIEIKSKKGKGTAISIIFPTFQESSKETIAQPTPIIA